ncbi:histone-lysine N-methyltransferase [Elysia marginata]|uniref:Histone-lysine N-methyltransferase n=1 Tax=Elysia marginata TaxID=1093978 RepID=A0AAV4IXI3_9GAST|nr:histone-lysine N-methyltransferase [Elysia marginata]
MLGRGIEKSNCQAAVSRVSSFQLIQPGQFSILRRVCVDLNKVKARTPWGKAVDPSTLSVLIGSCTIESLGVLKSYLSDTDGCLLPIDFCFTRIYWSTQDARRRCVYTCKIVEVKPSGLDSPTGHIQDMRVVHDPAHPDFVPLDQLNLEICGVPNFMKRMPDSNSSDGISMDVSGGCQVTNNIMSFNMSKYTATGLTTASSIISWQTVQSVNQEAAVRSKRASSWSHSGDHSTDSPSRFVIDPDNPFGEVSPFPDPQEKAEVLTEPVEPPAKKKPVTMDLSCLSPSTLALLSIKDPKQYVPPKRDETSRSKRGSSAPAAQERHAEEELGLVKIAERLNKAASFKPKQVQKKKRSSVSPLAAAARRKEFAPLPSSFPNMNPYVPRSLLPPLQKTSVPRQKFVHHYGQPYFKLREQSLSPLTVMPRPQPRPRSNSEDSYRGHVVQSLFAPPSSSSSVTLPMPPDATQEKPLAKERKVYVILNDKSKIQVSAVRRTSPMPVQMSSSSDQQKPPRPRAAFRARSQSPFTVISTLDTGTPKIHDFRSASVSPPPVTRGPGFSLLARSGPTPSKPGPAISQKNAQLETSGNDMATHSKNNSSNNFVEISDSDEEDVNRSHEKLNVLCSGVNSRAGPKRGYTSSEETERGMDCVKVHMIAEEPHQRGPNAAAVARESEVDDEQGAVVETEDVLSSERIQSLLENVPQEVLEGEENVQLVVLPPGSTEGLSEEDVVKLAQSVVAGRDGMEGAESSSIQEVADSNPTQVTGCDGVHGCGSDEESDEKICDNSNKSTNCDDVKQENGGNAGENRKELSEKSMDNNEDERKYSTHDINPNCDVLHGNAEMKKCASQGDDGTSNTDSTSADKGSGNDRTNNNQSSSSSFRSGGQSKGGASGRKSNGGGGGGDGREPWNGGAGRNAQDKTGDSSEENPGNEKPPPEEGDEETEAISKDDDEESIGKQSHQKDEVDGKLSTNVKDLTQKKAEENEDLHDQVVTTENFKPSSLPEISVEDSSIVSSPHSSQLTYSHERSVREEQPEDDKAEQEFDDDDEGEDSDIEQARGESIFNSKNNSNNNSIFQANVSAVSIAEETPTEEEEGDMEIIDLSDPGTNIDADLEKSLITQEQSHTAVATCDDNSSSMVTDLKSNLTKLNKDGGFELQPKAKYTSSSDPLTPSKTIVAENVDLDTIEKEEGELDPPPQPKKKKKQTCKVYINRQDMTDEDSDYLMLDDFSYSETTTTNGEEEGQSGRSSAEIATGSRENDDLKTSEGGNQELDIAATKDNKACVGLGALDADHEKSKSVEATADNFDAEDNTRDNAEAILPFTNAPLESLDTSEKKSPPPDVISASESLHLDQESSVNVECVVDQGLQQCATSLEEQSATVDPVATEKELLPHQSEPSPRGKASPSSPPEDEENDKVSKEERSFKESENLCTTKTLKVSVRRLSKPELREFVPEGDTSPEQVNSTSDHVSECEGDKKYVGKCETGSECEIDDNCKAESETERGDQKLVKCQKEEEIKVSNFEADTHVKEELETKREKESHPKNLEIIEDKEKREDCDERLTGCTSAETQKNAVEGDDKSDLPSAHSGSVYNSADEQDVETNKVDGMREQTFIENSSAVVKEPKNEGDLSNKNANSEVHCDEIKHEEDEKLKEISVSTPGDVGTARERMLEKIKAEGLAKSEPGEEGPFKCPMCKRLYRTRLSYEAHVKDCDFEVSTSDEEEVGLAPMEKRDLRSSKKKLQDNISKSTNDGPRLKKGSKDKTSLSAAKIDLNPEEESEKETFERMRKERKGVSLSPLNEPLSIIIGDECREGSASSRDRDLSDDCSSQDSRRSSLRRSTMTQRNAAPAHLAKLRCRDSLSKGSPNGSTTAVSPSCLLSPRGGKSSALRALEEKSSPKETMLEAVGLVSKRTLELSPNSELATGILDIEPGSSGGEQTCAVKLQPRFSPTTMAVVPKREKRNSALVPASSGPVGAVTKPSIMAGGKVATAKPELESPRIKSVSIESNPVVLTEVSIGPAKKPRKKRIWWVEATDSSGEEEGKELEEDPLAGIEEGGVVATRTRHGRQRLSEEGTDSKKSQKKDGKLAAGTVVESARVAAKEKSSLPEKQKAADLHMPMESESTTTNHEMKNSKEENKEVDNSVHVPTLRSSRRTSQRASNDDEDVNNKVKEKQKDCVETDVLSTRSNRKSKTDLYADEVDSGDHLSSKDPMSSDVNNLAKQDQDVQMDSGESSNDDSGEEENSPTGQADDDRKSPVRRSCRPSSKTPKLSEFLAKLKEKEGQEKEKVDTQHSPFSSSSPQKRGRGRPRLYPVKDLPASNRGRGRGRGRPRMVSRPEDEEGKNDIPPKSTDEKPKVDLNEKENKSTLEEAPSVPVVSSSHEGSAQMPKDNDCIESFEDENDGNTQDNKNAELENNENHEEEKQEMDNDIEKGLNSNEKDIISVETGSSTTNKEASSFVSTGESSSKDEDTTCKAQEKVTPKAEENCTAPGKLHQSKPSTVPEALRGQRLRIIVRSPNVLAAQKVGELIKQTAQQVDPNTKDISICMEEKDKGSSKPPEPSTEVGCKNKVSSSATSDVYNFPKTLSEEKKELDTDDSHSKGSKAENEVNHVESRSASPQSLSAAYDIQSDDFSSETSNDTEDFVPRSLASGASRVQEGEKTQAESHMLTNFSSLRGVDSNLSGRRVSVLPLHNATKSSDKGFNVEDHNDDDDDDDDDVVLVKAIGLQPPEPQLAQNRSHVLLYHHEQQQKVDSQETNLSVKPTSTSSSLHSSQNLSSPSSSSGTNTFQHNILLQGHHHQPQQHQAGFISSPPTSAAAALSQVKAQLPHVVSDVAQARYILQQQGQQQMPILSPPQVSLASTGRIVLGNLTPQAGTSKQGAVLLSTNTSPIQTASAASGLIFPNGCPSGIALAGGQTGLNLQATANQSGIPVQAVNQHGIAFLQGVNQSTVPLQAVSPSGVAFQTGSPQGLALQTSQGAGLALQTAGQQGGGPILVNQTSSAARVVYGSDQTAHLQGLVQGSVSPAQQSGLSVISLGGPSNILSHLQALNPQQQQPLGQVPHIPQALPSGSPTLLPGMAALNSIVERHALGGGGARVGESSSQNPRHLIIGQQPRLLLSQQQLQQQQLQIPYQQHKLSSPPCTPFSHLTPQPTSSLGSGNLLSPLASQGTGRIVSSTGVGMVPTSASPLQQVGSAGARGIHSSQSTPTPQLTPVSSAPQLTHVDGTPAQVNYMGTFDLNSSTLQSVMSGQGITQNTTQMIKDLVQRALHSRGQEVIPGVEVKSAITDTPQGPKKVLRVFINEDILPIQRSPQPAPSHSSSNITNAGPDTPNPTATSLTSVQQYSQQQTALAQTPNIAAVAAASLQPLRRPAASTGVSEGEQRQNPTTLPSPTQLPTTSTHLPNWTKLLQPQFFQPYESKSTTAVNNTTTATETTSQEQPQAHRHLKPQSGSNFRRALKPVVHASHTSAAGGLKRNSGSGNQDVVNKRARTVFEKTQLEDGSYTGRLEGMVNRCLEPPTPVSSTLSASPSQLKSEGELTLNHQETSVGHVRASCPTLVSALQPSNSTPFTRAVGDTSIPSTVTDLSLQAQPKSMDQGVQSEETPTAPVQQDHHPQPPPDHRPQQQLSLQRASFPNPSASSGLLKSQKVSLASRKHLQKHLMKKTNQRKNLKSKEPGSSISVPRRKALGKKGTANMKIAESHHRLIHHIKKGGEQLPQPMLEEEVVATPLDMLSRGDHPAGGRGARGKGSEQNQSRLRFEISSDDGFSCQGDTMEDAWNQVLEKVQDVRAASRMKQLSYAGVSGRSISGLENNSVVYLLEQLYGAVHCHQNYKFRFHKYDLDQADAEVGINESGSARSEAFSTRKPFDMFNFLKSVYRTRPGDEERDKEEEMSLKSSRRATSLSLPMAMRFRKLKTFAKEAVDVYRSKIHGRGLFCKRNIDAGEMVIEYAGEVIRASLTDKREKYYEGKGIGCYMFRIDDDEVVDATMHGSAARFINHSCEPNCFSKVILVEGKKHIVIFAMRPIKRGEELTYDYKFPIEEVKIPCSCGSRRCRKYLN